jgi:hypothetical protein
MRYMSCNIKFVSYGHYETNISQIQQVLNILKENQRLKFYVVSKFA